MSYGTVHETRRDPTTGRRVVVERAMTPEEVAARDAERAAQEIVETRREQAQQRRRQAHGRIAVAGKLAAINAALASLDSITGVAQMLPVLRMIMETQRDILTMLGAEAEEVNGRP